MCCRRSLQAGHPASQAASPNERAYSIAWAKLGPEQSLCERKRELMRLRACWVPGCLGPGRDEQGGRVGMGRGAGEVRRQGKVNRMNAHTFHPVLISINHFLFCKRLLAANYQ